jgi:hypothetical protein
MHCKTCRFLCRWISAPPQKARATQADVWSNTKTRAKTGPFCGQCRAPPNIYSLDAHLDCHLDGEDLLGNHAQHLGGGSMRRSRHGGARRLHSQGSLTH